jgi:hypothetical protein
MSCKLCIHYTFGRPGSKESVEQVVQKQNACSLAFR